MALLLNQVTLAPGEAIWMPAGNLHAYLPGTGIEIMAASDNVLRGGLTPKRVDVDELLKVLRFEVLDDPILRSHRARPRRANLAGPDPRLRPVPRHARRHRPHTEVPAAGPRIILAIEGDLFVGQAIDGTPVDSTGTAAYAPAEAGPATTRRRRSPFVAAVP